MSQIKLVLFDCDGVIVDSERLSIQMLRDDLAAHGLDLPVAEVNSLFVGGTLSGGMALARSMGAELPDDWLDDFYPKLYAHLAKEVELVPGIGEVLDELDARGVPYAVGSNGRVKKMHVTLGKTGLLSRFEGKLYSGQEMDKPKPFPDVYLAAAADHGIDPADCAVIEDSVNGIKAGHAAGMQCFGFTRDTEAELLAPFADHLFNQMSELTGLLFGGE